MKLIIGILCFSILCFPVLAKVNLEESILQSIEQYSREKIGSEEVELKISLKKYGKNLDQEVDSVKIVEVYNEPKAVGNVILPFEIVDGDKTKKVFIRARVEVLREVVVAKNKIERGQQISEEDVVLEKRDIAVLPKKFFAEPDYLLITQAKTTIPKGSTIFEWMVKEIPLIRHGEEVMIRMLGDNLLVETKGIVLEDGYPGQKVRFRAKDSKDIVVGRVVALGIVEVKI